MTVYLGWGVGRGGWSESERDSENESSSESKSECEFSVGENVYCNWYEDGSDNQQYTPVVLYIDIESHTTHVRAEDGDEKEDMGWD